MGAANFVTYQPGEDPAKAFDDAVASAKAAYGEHGGDSGTIAEKKSFIVLDGDPVSEFEAMDLAKNLMGDPRVGGKYGPAGAIPVFDEDGGPGWVFFGSAPC
jgi:hypothetical protein